MWIGQKDGFLEASLTTGPRHAVLQLRLADAPVAVTLCDPLPPEGGCHRPALDRERIVEVVRSAIAEANQRYGTAFYPSYIRYDAYGFQIEDMYRRLVSVLIAELASGRIKLL